MDGMKKLIPYITTHPEDSQNILQYVTNFGLDKNDFGELLASSAGSFISTLYTYYISGGTPAPTEELIEAKQILDYMIHRPEFKDKEEHFMKSLQKDVSGKVQNRNQRPTEDVKTLHSRKKKQTDIDDKEFLHEMKLSMLPADITKKVTKRSNVKELEMARNIAEIEVTITEY